MIDGPIPDRGFDASYGGTPPWDIGRPQREFVRLAEAGEITGSVLDVGCGTGEHAIFFERRGHDVLGVDAAPSAIAKARVKATAHDSAAQFLVADALDLGDLGRVFDTILDCGVFHVFDDVERPRYAASIHAALRPGGRFFTLVFSEREPPGYGPRRVTRPEIEATFSDGFTVESVVPAVFETLLATGDVAGWLARIRRE
jgi:SAM-dependent methyltransferase